MLSFIAQAIKVLNLYPDEGTPMGERNLHYMGTLPASTRFTVMKFTQTFTQVLGNNSRKRYNVLIGIYISFKYVILIAQAKIDNYLTYRALQHANPRFLCLKIPFL